MKENETLKRAIGQQFLDLYTVFEALDKQVRKFGTDVDIFHSEIRMLSHIAKNAGIHVGGLAELLRITKGSVSEIVKKLEKKGLVEKRVSDDNLSKLSLWLTEKGRVAYTDHMRYHAMLDEALGAGLVSASEENLWFLLGFLKSANETTVKLFTEV
ncbi:MAG: MarR family winged helix-turn-helix transcriptional regulator [Peptococcaceae bacterium]|jgi:DNA-binding MarR family transcriptional regulator|nr:MarR family winged helix-turn-helix transcriptional regulator [Peptococcaceae bacterium]